MATKKPQDASSTFADNWANVGNTTASSPSAADVAASEAYRQWLSDNKLTDSTENRSKYTASLSGTPGSKSGPSAKQVAIMKAHLGDMPSDPKFAAGKSKEERGANARMLANTTIKKGMSKDQIKAIQAARVWFTGQKKGGSKKHKAYYADNSLKAKILGKTNPTPAKAKPKPAKSSSGSSGTNGTVSSSGTPAAKPKVTKKVVKGVKVTKDRSKGRLSAQGSAKLRSGDAASRPAKASLKPKPKPKPETPVAAPKRTARAGLTKSMDEGRKPVKVKRPTFADRRRARHGTPQNTTTLLPGRAGSMEMAQAAKKRSQEVAAQKQAAAQEKVTATQRKARKPKPLSITNPLAGVPNPLAGLAKPGRTTPTGPAGSRGPSREEQVKRAKTTATRVANEMAQWGYARPKRQKSRGGGITGR